MAKRKRDELKEVEKFVGEAGNFIGEAASHRRENCTQKSRSILAAGGKSTQREL